MEPCLSLTYLKDFAQKIMRVSNQLFSGKLKEGLHAYNTIETKWRLHWPYPKYTFRASTVHKPPGSNPSTRFPKTNLPWTLQNQASARNNTQTHRPTKTKKPKISKRTHPRTQQQNSQTTRLQVQTKLQDNLALAKQTHRPQRTQNHTHKTYGNHKPITHHPRHPHGPRSISRRHTHTNWPKNQRSSLQRPLQNTLPPHTPPHLHQNRPNPEGYFYDQKVPGKVGGAPRIIMTNLFEPSVS